MQTGAESSNIKNNEDIYFVTFFSASSSFFLTSLLYLSLCLRMSLYYPSLPQFSSLPLFPVYVFIFIILTRLLFPFGFWLSLLLFLFLSSSFLSFLHPSLFHTPLFGLLLFIYISIYPFIHPSIYIYIYLYQSIIYIYIYLSICLSVYLSNHLFKSTGMLRGHTE